MKLVLTSIAATLATASAAFASGFTRAVPEIDAMAGLAAIGVVGAAVALIRERSR